MRKVGAPKANNNARRGTDFRDALRLAIGRSQGSLGRIASKLLTMAEEGDLDAIKEIANRLDGKPVNVVAGEEGMPSAITFTITAPFNPNQDEKLIPAPARQIDFDTDD